MRHCADLSSRCGEMAVFQDGGFTATLIFKVINFKCQYGLDGQCASAGQVLCQLVSRCINVAIFRFFKMAAIRYLGFLKV